MVPYDHPWVRRLASFTERCLAGLVGCEPPPPPHADDIAEEATSVTQRAIQQAYTPSRASTMREGAGGGCRPGRALNALSSRRAGILRDPA